MGKDILSYPFGLYGLAFILKMDKQNLQAGKVDDRISILQLDTGAKNKMKMSPRYKSRKMVLKQNSGWRLDSKIVEACYSSYKVNCDQLLHMQHSQNELDKHQNRISTKNRTLDLKIQIQITPPSSDTK